MKNIVYNVIRILIVIMLFLTTAILITYVAIEKEPLLSDGETVSIEAKSKTFSGVLEQNKDSFKNIYFVKAYNRFNKVSITVKEGEYIFPKEISLEELISCLESGKYNQSIQKVTIPEGYTITQIGDVLESKGIINKVEFLSACKDYELPSYIKDNPKKRYALEGYLFPDTYMLEKGMSGSDIIGVFIKRFDDVISSLEAETGLSVDDKDMDSLIIKASMIEREVSKSDEKPMVSSVIDNRIKKGMKLQIDATVLYAMGEHKDKVLYSDLKTKSPYNTYYVNGLPVGAISNPGKESIRAAMEPLDTEYLYYMTKDGVNHRFFKTYDEFLKYKNN